MPVNASQPVMLHSSADAGVLLPAVVCRNGIMEVLEHVWQSYHVDTDLTAVHLSVQSAGLCTYICASQMGMIQLCINGCACAAAALCRLPPRP